MAATKIYIEGSNIVIKDAADNILKVLPSIGTFAHPSNSDGQFTNEGIVSNVVYLNNSPSNRETFGERFLIDVSLITVPAPPLGGWTQTLLLQKLSDNYLGKTAAVSVDTSLLATKDNQTNGSQKVQVTNQYLDAFGLVKTGDPATRLDVEFNYNKQEEVFDEILGAGGGTVTHDANARHLLLATGGTATNRSACMRSYPVPYTPGNSQGIYLTGVLNYANIANGTAQLFLRSNVTGSVEEQVVNQADWNINGVSTLATHSDVDWKFSQIFDMDFQSLKVGIIRHKLNRKGAPVILNEMYNDNIRNSGYWQNPCLPVYWRIYNDATYTYMEQGYGNESNAIGIRYRVPLNALATMTAICCTVKSGAGVKLFDMDGYPISVDMGFTTKTVSTTLIPLLSIRQRSTFNSIENLSLAIPQELTVQTDNPIRLVVYHDSILTGASWVNVDTDHSTIEYDVSATSFTNGHVVLSDYAATSKNIIAAATSLLSKTLLWARKGSKTGILTIAAQKSASPNASVLVGTKLKEIR